jgi:FAD/FMN-containing dehydrogenase
MTAAAHREKLERLAAEASRVLHAGASAGAAPIGLAKPTSNLFRDRAPARPRLDLRGFDEVIEVDATQGRVDAEGMVTYAALVDATLAQQAMPCVVPQLRSITLGGALAGVGIEASSCRHGLVHETVESFDVLTGDGRVVHCRPDNEHRELFFGFPNSYGTLGYALSVRARTQRVRPFVAIEHRRCAGAADAFRELAALTAGSGASDYRPAGDIDFLEGVAFGPEEVVLTLGRFVDRAPYVGDYGYERIYWRSLRERERDYLATRDFLWRWDTDWFWCSRQLGAQHPLVRRLLGRRRLNSITYQRVMRWNSRWGITRAWERVRGLHGESVIQDVQIPAARAAEFLQFLAREIGIWPVWLCPIRPAPAGVRWPLFALAPGVVHVNFGFWDVVRTGAPHAPGHFNRLVEAEVGRLGGRKSLYSESWYTPDEFWADHDRDAYRALKQRYDPAGRLGDLYAKCCMRH